jgi:predicted ATP-grasp superfamily ATP-dependent carboligase
MREPIPAVVVGGQVNGLGVVRSLAAAGVPTITIDTTLRHAAMWSRAGKRIVVNQLSGRPFVNSLLKLQSELGCRPVLILTDETAVMTVSDYRSELSEAYRFHLPSPGMVTVLENKARFQEFAERHDLPVPPTVVLRTEADIEKLSRLRYPLIAKPADKRFVHSGRARRLGYIANPDEARAVCRELLATAGEFVVQEWVEGPDSEIYFSLFHHGKSPATTAVFHGRKLVSYPPRVGSTAICVAAPEVADILGPITESFLALSGYEGLGSLEFKWDAAAKRFIIIEPTVGRTDWQEEIATLSGVNLPLAAYRHELGLEAVAHQEVQPVAWRESFRQGGAGKPPLAGVRNHDG